MACLGASLSLSLFFKLWGIRNLNEMWEREEELSFKKDLVSGLCSPGGRERAASEWRERDDSVPQAAKEQPAFGCSQSLTRSKYELLNNLQFHDLLVDNL